MLKARPGGDAILAKLNERTRAQLLQAMPGLKERAKTLIELFEASRFLWADRPLAITDQARALLTSDAKALLGRLVPALEAVPDWNGPAIEAVVRAFAESATVKLGAVAQPLRAALTGKTTSPPIFDVLAVLGRNESLERLRAQAATA